MAHTAETVKKDMPMIEILLLGRKHAAKLSAASPRTATATIRRGPRALEQYEFAWEMIADALNTNTPLTPLR